QGLSFFALHNNYFVYYLNQKKSLQSLFLMRLAFTNGQKAFSYLAGKMVLEDQPTEIITNPLSPCGGEGWGEGGNI
ncbi:MAG: hypothetical protein ACOC6L_03305, partial [Thermodesulfobacteriota bacterium]